MKCADCPYWWKTENDRWPTCQFRENDPWGTAPCEEEENYKNEPDPDDLMYIEPDDYFPEEIRKKLFAEH